MRVVGWPVLPDHGWIDDGGGVLSCIAGDLHTPTRAAVCPYYLRADIVAALPDHRGVPPEPALRWHGDAYYKISQLCQPSGWRQLIAALPTVHQLRPLPWSLFTALDHTTSALVLDPRAALRIALRSSSSPVTETLAAILTGLGDHSNEVGVLGLTGSAALDPTRLPSVAERDVDLTIYPAAFTAEPAGSAPYDVPALLIEVLRSHGAVFLADLPADDPRRERFLRSRLMPPTADPASAEVFLRRRTDLAWIGELRLDLTLSHPRPPTDDLPYTRPAAARTVHHGVIVTVTDTYPVRIGLRCHTSSPPLDVLITARGYQTALRPGDRITVVGNLHHPPDGRRFLSVDDCADHRLTLTTVEGHR